MFIEQGTCKGPVVRKQFGKFQEHRSQEEMRLDKGARTRI